MPAYKDFRLNRVIRQVTNTPIESATTALVVSLKADSSQQFNIYGVTFGMEFLLQADKALILFVPCAAFLDIDDASIDGLTLPNLGQDKVWYDSITDGADGVKHIDFANPLVVNGDRKIVFVLYPPFVSGALGSTPTFILEVRGEVTQSEAQEKMRYGRYIPR